MSDSSARAALWLLSGPRQAGKTTLCRRLAEQARGRGWDVAGLLSPAILHAGIRTGIAVEDLRSGETRLLAEAGPAPALTLAQGRWRFDPAAVDWGNRVLANSLPCDLLIVDELGPLELERGLGWTAGLSVLRQNGYRRGLVVVRPELVVAARSLLPIRAVLALPGQIDLDALLVGELTKP